MKHKIFHFIAFLLMTVGINAGLLIAMSIIPGQSMAVNKNTKTMMKQNLDPEPDFRYPQTVSANALIAYDAAVKRSDYPVAIQALIQYALAETSRTDSAGNDVLQRCEKMMKQCERVDCKALVRHLQSRLLLKMAYRDYTQRDSLLNAARQRHEEAKALAKDLTVSPKQMGEGLFRADDLGFRTIPTLYDYLLSWEQDQWDLQKNFYADRKSFYQSWLALHTSDSDQSAQMYLEYMLLQYSGNSYSANQAYVRKYPDSPYADACRQRIAKEERESSHLQYTDLVTSQDSIRVTVTVDNLHACTLTLYCIPEGLQPNKNNEYPVASLQPVATTEVHCDDVIPFHDRMLQAVFAPQPYGRYLVLPSFRSRDGSMQQDKGLSRYRLENQRLCVSDLACYVVEQGSEANRLVVVNRITGEPQQGVDVRLTLYPQGRRSQWVDGQRQDPVKEVKNYRTEAGGFLTVSPNVPFDYQLSRGKDHYLAEAQCSTADRTLPSEYAQANVFLDLGIYRPGETLRGTAVAYNIGTARRQPLANASLKLVLQDASYNTVDTWTGQTDDMGQVLFSFPIPTDRMNGTWTLGYEGRRQGNEEGRSDVRGSVRFEVSEYKAPTFSVDMSETATLQQSGQPAILRGQVNTFSGMPVADAEVSLSLTRRSWWWRSDDAFEEKTMTAHTDARGHFEYTCPAEWFPTAQQQGSRYCYIYQVQAHCTNTAGESHDASWSFRVGNAYALTLSDSEILLPAKGKVKIPIAYSTTDPHPSPARCHYVLMLANDTTQVVREGDFMTDDPSFDWTAVPSGQYRFRAQVVSDVEAEPADAVLTLYRENDRMPANDRVLWIPEATRRIGRDGRTDILIGSATGCHVYYVTESRTRIETSGWLHYQAGMHHLQLPMPQGNDEYLSLTLVTLRDGKVSREQFRIESPRKDRLHLAATSFRDKVIPGQQERWTFRLTDDQGHAISSARLLLEAYNRSLHQLAPNPWMMSASLLDGSLYQLSTAEPGQSYHSLSYIVGRYSSISPMLPTLWLYDQDFFVSRMHEPLMMKEMMVSRAAAGDFVEERIMACEDNNAAMVEEEEIVIGYAASAPAPTAGKQKVQSAQAGPTETLRTGDVHVALWQPRLVADAEGNVSVTFDVPQQNTTWVVQALAYSSTMATDSWTANVLAQRLLMVQPVLPRFLRQGDKAQLKAQVMNASEETQQAHVTIELFDPRSQAILKAETFDLELKAKGTEVVAISCEVPVDAPYIGFRVKANSADGSGDGEQQLLPITTDISPVIETHPFYLQPGKNTFHQPLPASQQGRLTLELCANPTWYCITALPTLIDEEAHTSTALVHALYGLSLAETLANSQPEIRDAIGQWMQLHGSDSASYDPLLSALQQNADLKIGTLKASPWLSAAESQSLRMSQLQQLFDQSRNQALYDRLINRLTTLQRPDGGFAWYDYEGCVSSPWTTQVVAELIGELRHLGCLTDDHRLTRMAHRAIAYLERDAIETERLLLKERGRRDIYSAFESFAYVRTLFINELPVNDRNVKRILTKTFDNMEKHWGERSLSAKAFIAITLYRQGRASAARSIIESIRQFALTHPVKGMYWERLADGFWINPVAATATILQAMAEIDPRTEELNSIRQWLLLEKQTSNWGGSSLASDAIYALLSTGDDWLKPVLADSVLSVLVDGQPVMLNASDAYLGYVRMDLPIETREVVVNHTADLPAWGALYHQYVAPMKQIEAESIPELSVTKAFYVQDAQGKWQPAQSFKVGQRVQVRLLVHADKAFEFVTLHDERPALLEPVDQTSHYAWNERVGYFHETKDRETNLFFSRIPAGNHLFTYECDVTHEGTFTSGIATIQSQYAPQFTAHSAGDEIQAVR